MKVLAILLTLLVGYFVITSEVIAPDNIFFPTNKLPKPLTTILLTGDVMLGRSVNITSLDKNDPTYPFHKVGDALRSADITFINLENPIISSCPRISGGFTFCADPKMVEGLIFSGVDVVGLANNHTLNYGKDGYEQTKNFLTSAKIDYVDSTLAIKQVNNTTFGFLAFDKSQQSNPVLTNTEIQLIESEDKKVDILFIAMHWGVEYESIALSGVKKLAGELVNLGADVVVGSHPHWVQDMENINGVPVYYSLGNFVFDQMWSEETKKGLAIKLTFDGKKIIKDEQLPVYIRQIGQPEWVTE